jgi:aryl-alcohol dehydrogenase-like predicted oxidoreductase
VEVTSVRSAGVVAFQNERGWQTVRALEEIAKNHGSTIPAVALAWLRAQPTVSVPIASARTLEQLEQMIQVIELNPDEIALLSKITA